MRIMINLSGFRFRSCVAKIETHADSDCHPYNIINSYLIAMFLDKSFKTFKMDEEMIDKHNILEVSLSKAPLHCFCENKLLQYNNMFDM